MYQLLVFIAFIACFACACNGRNERFEDPKGEGLSLRVRHELKHQVKDDWKVESWLDGTALRPGENIRVWVRLLSQKKDEETPPAIRLNVSVLEGDRSLNVGSFSPTLRSCSGMPKLKEITRVDHEWGTVTFFPPKEVCWEGGTPDRGGLSAPASGEYSVHVEVLVKNGPTFLLDRMPISVRSRDK